MVNTINYDKNGVDYTTAGYQNISNSNSNLRTSTTSTNSNSITNNQIIKIDEIKKRIAPFWYVSKTFSIGTEMAKVFEISFQYAVDLSSLAFQIIDGSSPTTFYITSNGSELIINDQNQNAGQNYNVVNFSLPNGYFVHIPKNVPILVFAYSSSATTGHIAFNGIKEL